MLGRLSIKTSPPIEARNTQIVQFRRPFAMQHPETAWALEAMVQRVREAAAR